MLNRRTFLKKRLFGYLKKIGNVNKKRKKDTNLLTCVRKAARKIKKNNKSESKRKPNPPERSMVNSSQAT